MNDYRCKTKEQLCKLLEAAEEEDNNPNWERGWVRHDLPPDREGLIAAFHDQCMVDPMHIVHVNTMAEDVAVRSQQRVYLVMTVTRWHLLLFARATMARTTSRKTGAMPTTSSLATTTRTGRGTWWGAREGKGRRCGGPRR